MHDRTDYIAGKLISGDDVTRKMNLWRMRGEKIVFTNGCFDILHRGHVTYLLEAAQLGQRLVVGVNSDRSVKAQNKGADRPVNDEEARMFLLAALGFVDAVIRFDEDTPLELIRNIRPDVLVKGGDYNASQTDSGAKDFIVGSDIVRQYGGRVETIDLVDGYSTTSLIDRLRK